MYTPIQLGISDYFQDKVTYRQFSPALRHAAVVECFWQLKSQSDQSNQADQSSQTGLDREFSYHVLPDACIDIIFTIGADEPATVMTPSTSAETINLGSRFDYAGIRLKVGVWRNPEAIIGRQVPMDELLKDLPATTAIDLKDDDGLEANLNRFLDRIKPTFLTEPSAIVSAILQHVSEIYSVDDMATVSGYSTRQLQRILRQETGFSPHDLLKIIRFQRSLKETQQTQQAQTGHKGQDGQGYSADLFSDQSHFIRDFKQRTGSKPSTFYRTYGR